MSRVFEELKRRKVFRVAAAYAVLSWLLLQVADTISPMMNLPEVAPRLVLFLLVVLFPVAVFLAWAFELRPTDGVAVSGQSIGRGAMSLGAVMLVIGGLAWYALWGRPDTGTPEAVASLTAVNDPAPIRGSIAVLPFADLSAEGDQEYFGDGIAEELLNVLASIRELSVASRTSAFAFKGENRNISEIAEILNVSYVLEGSVRKAMNRVRITAQLIDATKDRHIWSDTFDRELTASNIFAIQDEIAKAIVDALNDELGLSVDASIHVDAVTESLDAYDLYLQAVQLSNIKTVESVKSLVATLERAVELDPDFAEAWGFLAAWTSWLPTWDHSLDPEPYHRSAVEIAHHALGLDPANQDAHQALISAHFSLQEWELYQRAVDDVARQFPDRIENPEEPMGLGYLRHAYDLALQYSAVLPDEAFYELLQALYFNHTREPEKAIPKFKAAILKGYNGGAELDLADAYFSLGDDAVMSAILSKDFEAHDPELLRLLPHIIELMSAPAVEFDRASARFRIVARELGFEEADLLRAGPRWGIRTPLRVAMAYDRFDLITDEYWSNSPMFWMWAPYLQPWRRSDAFRQRVRSSGMLAHWQKHGWPDLCRPVGTDDFECD